MSSSASGTPDLDLLLRTWRSYSNGRNKWCARVDDWANVNPPKVSTGLGMNFIPVTAKASVSKLYTRLHKTYSEVADLASLYRDSFAV